MMNKRGTAGLPLLLSVVTLLFMIGLVVFIFSITGGEVATATQETQSLPEPVWTTNLNTSLEFYTYFENNPTSNAIAGFTNFYAGSNDPDYLETTNCQRGNCYGFTQGVDNWLSAPRSTTFQTENLSFSLWFNSHTDTGQTQYLFSKYATSFSDDYYLYIDTSERLKFFWSDSAGGGHETTISSTIQRNQWYHVVVTMDGTNTVTYLDGELQTTTAIGGTGRQITTGDPTWAMRKNNEPTTKFNGTMDEFAFYTRPLLESEVTQLYNDPFGALEYNYAGGRTYDVLVNSQAGQVAEDTTTSIAGVTTWFGIIVVITAMVVLILLTILIITAIRGSGLIRGGSA